MRISALLLLTMLSGCVPVSHVMQDDELCDFWLLQHPTAWRKGMRAETTDSQYVFTATPIVNEDSRHTILEGSALVLPARNDRYVMLDARGLTRLWHNLEIDFRTTSGEKRTAPPGFWYLLYQNGLPEYLVLHGVSGDGDGAAAGASLRFPLRYIVSVEYVSHYKTPLLDLLLELCVSSDD